MGSQSADEFARGYDPLAHPYEGPVHDVEVSAFFASKYEVTQAQWARLTGEYPSRLYPDGSAGLTFHNPVERVNWPDSRRFARMLGLDLPSEAQWEYACRAGTQTPWSWPVGAEPRHYANLKDKAYLRAYRADNVDAEPWNDRFGKHAPVGSYLPNDFGLHDVHGNVREWVLDIYLHYPPYRVRDPVTLEFEPEFNWSPHQVTDTRSRMMRGGCHAELAIEARSGNRSIQEISTASDNAGFRPVKRVVSSKDSPTLPE